MHLKLQDWGARNLLPTIPLSLPLPGIGLYSRYPIQPLEVHFGVGLDVWTRIRSCLGLCAEGTQELLEQFQVTGGFKRGFTWYMRGFASVGSRGFERVVSELEVWCRWREGEQS